jgi:hypothetical protein
MPTQDSAPQRGAVTANLLSWLGKHSAGLIVLAAVVYGVVLFAHDVFYSSFGIRPEEVGVGYLVVLPRAAVALAVYSGALLALLAIAGWPEILLRRTTEGSPQPLATAAGIAASRWWKRALVPWFRKRVSDWAGQEWKDRPPRDFRQLRFATLSGALVIVLAIVMANIAEGRVMAVRQGKALEPSAVSLLSVRVNKVSHLAWISATPTPPINPAHTIMYFGSSDGVSIFYDVDARVVVRIPSDTFFLTTEPNDLP